MTNGLDRNEKVDQFSNYLDWRAKTDLSDVLLINPSHQCDINSKSDSELPAVINTRTCNAGKHSQDCCWVPSLILSSHYFLPKYPSWPYMSQTVLTEWYSTVDFLQCLHQFLLQQNPLAGVLPCTEDIIHIYK